MLLLKKNVEDGFSNQRWVSLSWKGRFMFKSKLLLNSSNYSFWGFFSGYVSTLESYTCSLCLLHIIFECAGREKECTMLYFIA